MLFGFLKEEHYVDLVDSKGKVYKRFRDDNSYEEWVSRFSPEVLEGLFKKYTTLKWWESNTQIAKLAFPVLVVVAILLKSLR